MDILGKFSHCTALFDFTNDSFDFIVKTVIVNREDKTHHGKWSSMFANLKVTNFRVSDKNVYRVIFRNSLVLQLAYYFFLNQWVHELITFAFKIYNNTDYW